MTSLEFQSTLFPTQRDMLAAIAGEWLSAGGANDRSTMQEFLAAADDELARQCIESWGLDQPVREDDEQTWMEARGIDRDDMEAAFAHLRANFDAAFPYQREARA